MTNGSVKISTTALCYLEGKRLGIKDISLLLVYSSSKIKAYIIGSLSVDRFYTMNKTMQHIVWNDFTRPCEVESAVSRLL